MLQLLSTCFSQIVCCGDKYSTRRSCYTISYYLGLVSLLCVLFVDAVQKEPTYYIIICTRLPASHCTVFIVLFCRPPIVGDRVYFATSTTTTTTPRSCCTFQRRASYYERCRRRRLLLLLSWSFSPSEFSTTTTTTSISLVGTFQSVYYFKISVCVE